MKGIELALRFAYSVNTLRYCGPPEAAGRFREYLKKKENENEIRDSLKKFEGLYSYLTDIAEKHKKQPLDDEVIEAYWIGNDLLDGFDDEEIKQIVMNLTRRGLPESIGKALTENIPHGFVPHHNFNVMYVGVGNLTGSVEVTLQNMDNCRISWGTVKSIQDMEQPTLIVETDTLAQSDSQLLLKPTTKTAIYLKEMLPNVQVGDVVALHWGSAVMVLSGEQQSNLDKYTQKIIDVLNRSQVDD